MGEVVLEIASTAQTTSGFQNCLGMHALETAAVDVNVSAVTGTNPTLDVYYERQGADGVWYTLWHATQFTAAGTASTSVGPGCATAAVLTDHTRLRWVIGGTATPTFTFSASVIAR